MQRTLHPVGQGGFYTEQFFEITHPFKNSKLTNVVYDCGSSPSLYVENEIIRTFPRRSTIDVLFLSHFDNDHINGIQHLINRGIEINYLVLPLLNKKQKIIAYLETGIKEFDPNSLNAYFKTDKIKNVIYVKPYEAESFGNNSDNPNLTEKRYPAADISKVPREIKSGTGLNIGQLVNWVYIPFNVVDDSFYDDFKNYLTSHDAGSLQKLENFSGEGIDDNAWNKIKDIYKTFHNKILKNKNSSSLVVYSGPDIILSGKKDNLIHLVEMNANNYFVHLRRKTVNFTRQKELVAALYTGDINLSETVSVNNEKVMDEIISTLKYVIKNVGLVQVPHHGSRLNFDLNIISEIPDAFAYFYSYGTYNNYKHPFAGIRLELMTDNKYVFEITEKADSELVQIIKIS